MMNLNTPKVMINGSLVSSKSLGGILDVRDPYAYEVVRLIDGVPLFLNEHYSRLTNTLRLMGHDTPLTIDEFRDMMIRLADACGIANDNAKLMINSWKNDGSCDIYLTYLGAVYPSEDMYREGVRTGLIRAMRDNPQAKIGNRPLRLKTNEFIKENDLFEAILVDENGNITEGSRSNIFFIRENELYTSPASRVLLGVTRRKILEICSRSGIDVIEQPVQSKKIDRFDAAFISGTSPKVLPIRTIDGLSFNVNNELLRRVMKLYSSEIRRDLTAQKLMF